MATCPFCGKKMGIFENQTSEFPNDPGVCPACHDMLKNYVNEKIKNMMQAGLYFGEVFFAITYS